MRNCPACDAAPGERHESGCDVERCPVCGCQAIGCDCDWPDGGYAECVEYGWYCYLVPFEGWFQCDRDDPRGSPDLNRLMIECDWDRKTQRFVRR
jgi:hypothetical protein